jgi:hypothetical protein
VLNKELPEDRKIREYEEGIEKLIAEVAEAEAEMESEIAELARFQALYLARVGRLFLFDDALSLALVQEKQRQSPGDKGLAAEAAEAEARMNASRDEADRAQIETVAEITPDLKAQYREAIRMIHPDRAADEKDRSYRTELTKALNDAYRRGDADAVGAIMRDFQLAEMPDNAGKRLIVLIRQEHDLGRRLEDVRQSLDEIRNGDLARMQKFYTDSDAEGADPFAELTEAALDEIARKSRELAKMGVIPVKFAKI